MRLAVFSSYEDLESVEYGEKPVDIIQVNPGISAGARAARLSEWFTIGVGVPGCMHGGGSPDGAKLVIRTSASGS